MATAPKSSKKKTVKETKSIKAAAPVKRKVGAPKGSTNNPNGRPKGSKNKISYDIRKAIFEKVGNTTFVNGLFDDIKGIEDDDKRAKMKLELVKLFVPRPMNEDEAKDRDIKSAIFNKLAGVKEDE